jgi:hypothetical protein
MSPRLCRRARSRSTAAGWIYAGWRARSKSTVTGWIYVGRAPPPDPPTEEQVELLATEKHTLAWPTAAASSLPYPSPVELRGEAWLMRWRRLEAEASEAHGEVDETVIFKGRDNEAVNNSSPFKLQQPGVAPPCCSSLPRSRAVVLLVPARTLKEAGRREITVKRGHRLPFPTFRTCFGDC